MLLMDVCNFSISDIIARLSEWELTLKLSMALYSIADALAIEAELAAIMLAPKVAIAVSKSAASPTPNVAKDAVISATPKPYSVGPKYGPSATIVSLTNLPAAETDSEVLSPDSLITPVSTFDCDSLMS